MGFAWSLNLCQALWQPLRLVHRSTQCLITGTLSRQDATPCVHCPPGTHMPREGAAGCRSCPPGSYSAIFGAIHCSPCIHGSYAALPGSPACHLCPFGYATASDSAVTCDRIVSGTFEYGTQYGLAVSFALRLDGTNLEVVPQRTGIAAPPSDVLQFLVSLDAATAFGISTADVQVRRRPPVAPGQHPEHGLSCIDRRGLRMLIPQHVGSSNAALAHLACNCIH